MAWASAVALLLFFLPVMLAAARMGARAREVPTEALAYLVFGFGFGLVLGGVGGLARGLLHLVTGEPLPVGLALWIAIAAGWVLATGIAYGVILFLVWALRVLIPMPEPRARSAAGTPGPSITPSGQWAGPAPGPTAALRPRPERRVLVAAALCGLAGLALAMAGVIVLLEGWGTSRLLVAGAGLVVIALLLAVPAALRLRS